MAETKRCPDCKMIVQVDADGCCDHCGKNLDDEFTMDACNGCNCDCGGGCDMKTTENEDD